MLDVTTIPMKQFSLRWRLTDPKFCVLPPHHLEQIKPLDSASANWLLELTRPWFGEQLLTPGFFSEVTTTTIDYRAGEDEFRRIRKWLYQRGIPFKQRVYLSWNSTVAAMTTWKMVVRYWNEFWYPGSDDLAIFDESQTWVLFLWHECEAFFATHPVKQLH